MGAVDQLIRWVAACLGLEGIELPTVRRPEPVEFQPDLADRANTKWQAIVDLLAGRSRERILLFEVTIQKTASKPERKQLECSGCGSWR